MGIRQSLNDKPALAVVVLLLIFAAAGGVYYWYIHMSPPVSAGPRELFSDDDGATYFEDDASKIPPFDHNGKQAVLARVYQCGNAPPFVGYLQKFSDEAKQRIEDNRSTRQHAGPTKIDPKNGGLLIKQPKGGTWVPDNGPDAADVMNFTCPGGGKDFVPVSPKE